MKIVSLSAVLRRMGACDAARKWVRATGNARFADTWDACPNVAWMTGVAAHVYAYLPLDAYYNAMWSRPLNPANIREALPADVMEKAILEWWKGSR